MRSQSYVWLRSADTTAETGAAEQVADVELRREGVTELHGRVGDAVKRIEPVTRRDGSIPRRDEHAGQAVRRVDLDDFRRQQRPDIQVLPLRADWRA